MEQKYRLMSVHAHPDDESSKGAGTVARYSDQGVETVLVCCTGGEEGDILNERVDTPDVRADLSAVRMRELKAACEVIGYDVVEMLGYRDSGMKDSEANSHPDSFWATPVKESSDRLAALIRKYRPHVILSYGDPRGGYDHPDHVRVWEITEPAVAAAAAGNSLLGGEPWQVLKVYHSQWSRETMVAMHNAFGELGLESPFDEWWFERPDYDELITTRIDVEAWYGRRRAALLAHETQVDPNSPFWFGLPEEKMAEINRFETYELAWSKVSTELPEDELFSGMNLEDSDSSLLMSRDA